MADLKEPVFPLEFPYEFDVGSTETDSSSSSSDEEVDFLAELTRRLTRSSLSQTQKLSIPNSFTVEKKAAESTQWVVSGSPQSTLAGIGTCSSNGSPVGPSSQVPSPPTTPFGCQNDTWELIYAAAGEVARWKKMNSLEVAESKFGGRGLLGPPRIPSPTFNQFQPVRQDQVVLNRPTNVVGYGSGTSLCLQSQNAWPPLQSQHKYPNCHTRPALTNGSNVKRESTGTGVFLPRRYSNPSPTNEPPRKRAGCPTVLLPAKVVQALNLSFEDVNAHHHHHHHQHYPPRFNNAALAPNHEALVARRDALLTQQRRGLRQDGSLNYEVRLPQEWTY